MTQPEWLTSGAIVRVKSGSSREPDRLARVFSVDWPWLVYLDDRPGAVHPLRCSEYTISPTFDTPPAPELP